MKIISKFNDYYDGIQGYAPYADDLTYVRTLCEYDLSHAAEQVRRNAGQHELNEMLTRCNMYFPPILEGFERGIINFCGKRYPFWFVVNPDAKAGMKTMGFYDLSAVKEYMSQQEFAEKNPIYRKLIGRDKESLFRHNKYYMHYYRNEHLTPLTWTRFVNHFEHEDGLHHKNDDVFRYFDAPIIVVFTSNGATRAVVNERLNKFSFARVVDPFTAFQELSMFIGNNLAHVNDPDDLVMTDVQRAASKGFDKWSFRKKVR